MKAIVILGYRLNDDGTASDRLISRCEIGYREYEKGNCEKLVLSGGLANKNAGVTEAAVMKEFFLKKGVAEEAIILEDNSLTTLQNAKYCAKLLRGKITELILCTSKEHFARPYLNPYRLFKLAFLLSGIKIRKVS